MKEEKPINLSLVCAGEITLSTHCHLILPPQLQKELRVTEAKVKQEGPAKATCNTGPVTPNLRSQPLLLHFEK